MKQLIELFGLHFGYEPLSVLPLRAHGSSRKLFRLEGREDFTVVGVFGPEREENYAFLSFSRSLRGAGLPVPEIYVADDSKGIYLEQDLGDQTLFEALNKARSGNAVSEEMASVYERVAGLLARFQVEGAHSVNFADAYPTAEYDRAAMMWDLNYFKYHFLKLAGIDFNEARLEQDFERFCDQLLVAPREFFLYRDFQSRNIMLQGDDLWFIDYQGGRRGALQYDIASLLYDAKAALPDDFRQRILNKYLEEISARVPINRDEFLALYYPFVLIRIMQAMGAYGYRGFFERKQHFIASIPHAIENIRGILQAHPVLDTLPELRRVFDQIIARREEWAPLAADKAENASELTLHIRSFSYRAGYPQDGSGHGGGFVFDCRSLHNPGRYAEYKSLTGLNPSVVHFLESESAVEEYFASVSKLVDDAVRAYVERGFSNLSVSFGCTGGQHRSVYFSERLARHIRELFPGVRVELEHRERGNWPAA